MHFSHRVLYVVDDIGKTVVIVSVRDGAQRSLTMMA